MSRIIHGTSNPIRYLQKTQISSISWLRYLLPCLITNVFIWTAVVFYLQNAPKVFTSNWILTLPDSNPTTNISPANVGQASYLNTSPFSPSAYDPRENYKVIANTDTVLELAAKWAKVPIEKFGEPRVKIIDNTTLIEFEVSGSTPKEARDKSMGLYQALEQRLNQLRQMEITKRNENVQNTLEVSKQKLNVAQRKLADFKINSGLISPQQVTELTTGVEQLRTRYMDILFQIKAIDARFTQLSNTLNLSGLDAEFATALQADSIFQKLYADYGTVSAELVTLDSQFSPEYPSVIAAKAKRDAALRALTSRGRAVLNTSIGWNKLEELNLAGASGSTQPNFLGQLISSRVDSSVLRASAQELKKQIEGSEGRLNRYIQQGSSFEALKNEVQIAEAVLFSAIARSDAGQLNIYSVYPLVQLIKEPSLPKSSDAPMKKLVLLGAVLASLFTTSGFTLLGLRDWKNGRVNRSGLRKEGQNSKEPNVESIEV